MKLNDREKDRDSKLIGTNGDDVLFGSDTIDLAHGKFGNDLIFGGAGNDKLRGGHGDDVLIGGADSDLLIGGRGADEFRFEAGDGADRVRGFKVGEDALSFGDVGELHVEVVGKDTVVSYDGGQVTLIGVQADDIGLLLGGA